MTKLTAGLMGIGVIAAAAAGGYVALRSNATDLAASRTAAISAPGVGNAAAGGELPSTQPTTALDPAVTAKSSSTATSSMAPAPNTSASVGGVIGSESRTSSNAAQNPATNVPNAGTGQSAVNSAPTTAEVAPTVTASATPSAQLPVAPAPAAATTSASVPATATKYDEVTVLADAVLGLRLDSTISSETARVEDRVNARLTRDVLVDGRVAFASGSRLEGVVSQVERGGKFKDRPRLGVVFNTLVMADGTRVAIQTDTIFRDGDAPSGQANAKVGGSAVVGAILGAMIGGKKGAMLGGAAGAAGGAAAVAAGDRAEAVMTSGSSLTVRLTAPVTVLIEREYDSQGRHR
jgi:hypothetical protein